MFVTWIEPGTAPMAGITWAAPVAFAPLAWLLFGPLLFPAGATAVAVATVEPHPAGRYADLDVEFGLYANRRHPLRLDYEGAEPGLHPVARPGEPAEASDWILRGGPRRSAEPDAFEFGTKCQINPLDRIFPLRRLFGYSQKINQAGRADDGRGENNCQRQSSAGAGIDAEFGQECFLPGVRIPQHPPVPLIVNHIPAKPEVCPVLCKRPQRFN